MKKCTYCGRTYPDEVTQCAIDAYPLATEGMPAPLAMGPVEDVPNNVVSGSAGPDSPAQAAAKKSIIRGALWCVGGLIVTVVSYGEASGSRGGTYVVAWGAILFGGIRFIRGLMALDASKNPGPAGVSMPVAQTTEAVPVPVNPTVVKERKLWICDVCGEPSEPQYSTCWKCQSPRKDVETVKIGT